MKLIVNVKEGPHGVLVVVTDADIIGKKFTSEKVNLDLRQEFYKGSEMDKDEAKKKIVGARNIHLTGKEAVAIGVELDIVQSDRILWVDGVPHAQAVMPES